MLTPADISLEVTPLVETPVGFLRARNVGLEPDASFDQVLLSIMEAVERHLAAYNFTLASPGGRIALAARALARHYGAEAVLTAAETGSVRDPEGASHALSTADLAHWSAMKEGALSTAEQLLGPLPGPARSAVYFPSVRLRKM
jgi:hypothetical protein